MEWWEYLIVFVFWFGTCLQIAGWKNFEQFFISKKMARRGQFVNTQDFTLALLLVCFFLLLLIIYKLFIDPIW